MRRAQDSWAPIPSQVLPRCRYLTLPSRSVRAKLFFFFGGLHGCWCQARHVGAERQERLGAPLCISAHTTVPARLSAWISSHGDLLLKHGGQLPRLKQERGCPLLPLDKQTQRGFALS